MPVILDYYLLLGVPETADVATIRAAYVRLIKVRHPDVNTSPQATREAALLNEAYEVLSDPARRQSYDLRRRASRPIYAPPARPTTATPAWATIAWEDEVEPEREPGPRPRRRAASSWTHRGARRYDGEPPKPDIRRLTRLEQECLLRTGQFTVEWRYLDPSRVCRCYRCGHLWRSRNTVRAPRQCPACRSRTWSAHRLFHCIDCAGLFESSDCYTLPTTLFSACPHCQSGSWYQPSERMRLRINVEPTIGDTLVDRLRDTVTARA